MVDRVEETRGRSSWTGARSTGPSRSPGAPSARRRPRARSRARRGVAGATSSRSSSIVPHARGDGGPGAQGARDRAAVIVYAVGLCSMLVASTTYHRWVTHAAVRGGSGDGPTTPRSSSPSPARSRRCAWRCSGTVRGGADARRGVGGSRWPARRSSGSGGDAAIRSPPAMYIANGWAGAALVPALLGAGYGSYRWCCSVVGGVVYIDRGRSASRGAVDPLCGPESSRTTRCGTCAPWAPPGLHLATVWMVTT